MPKVKSWSNHPTLSWTEFLINYLGLARIQITRVSIKITIKMIHRRNLVKSDRQPMEPRNISMSKPRTSQVLVINPSRNLKERSSRQIQVWMSIQGDFQQGYSQIPLKMDMKAQKCTIRVLHTLTVLTINLTNLSIIRRIPIQSTPVYRRYPLPRIQLDLWINHQRTLMPVSI